MPKAPKICAACGSEYEQDALFCPADGTPLGSSRTTPGLDPYLGLAVAGQIELRQLIGIGSMGRVYRAFQRGVERDVAVKVLHRELSANSTLVTRFLREGRIASRLAHPNVVQVLMAGQLPSAMAEPSIGGEMYIVMEYLDGISMLSALAAAGGALPLPRALHITLQICDAVGEAHAQGVIHRDLKPENVMLVRRGNDPDFAKVLDFGIARLQWNERSSLATQAGLIFGTARYISPEGAQGQAVGPAADVYAIATMLYQCLAGRTPFDSDSPMTLLMQHAHEAPPPIQTVPRASYLPAPLANLLMRNLSKLPSERSQDARAFGRELVMAARASGLSPDDLIPRSTLLGTKASHAGSFASIQRTNKMNLTAEVVAIIGASANLPKDGPEESEPAEPAPVAESQPPAPEPPDHEPEITRPSAINDDDDRYSLPPKRRRYVRMIALAFVALVAGGVAVGAAMHVLPDKNVVSSDEYLQRANAAVRARQWDQPPGHSVRDITDEGLRLYPRHPGLLEVRRRAAEEVVASALGRKYAGDTDGALALARLALELAPSNTTAQHLIADLESLRAQQAPLAVEPSDAGNLQRRARPASTRAKASSSVAPPKPDASVSGDASAVIALPPAPASDSLPAAEPPSDEPATPPAPSSTSGRWL